MRGPFMTKPKRRAVSKGHSLGYNTIWLLRKPD